MGSTGAAMSRRRLLAGTAAATVAAGTGAQLLIGPPPAAAGTGDGDVVLAWFDQTAAAVSAAAWPIGAVAAPGRTAEQADIGLLWGQSSLSGYTQVLRRLVAAPGDLGRRVALLATFHAVSVDAQIAVYDAKYTYLRWRPVTAIQLADADGDPRTDPDPSWLPLITTPAHPEYPSGHCGYAGAALGVLTAFAGHDSPVPVTVTRTLTDGRVVQRDYGTRGVWRALAQDNRDARVWSGIHFRTSDERGEQVGLAVATHALRWSRP